jgi:hypothetical protein
VRLSSTLECVPELLNLLWGQLLAPAHNAQHLFALDLALPFASRLRFHALAIGLGVEEPRQEFEARIGGGGVARENRRDDQKGLQGAAPAFPAARTKIAPRNRFNGAISRPARNGKSAGHEPMRIGTREFRKELTLSFAVNSLPVDHAPFDPANFSLTAPSGALLFWQERDGQESARLLAPILA